MFGQNSTCASDQAPAKEAKKAKAAVIPMEKAWNSLAVAILSSLLTVGFTSLHLWWSSVALSEVGLRSFVQWMNLLERTLSSSGPFYVIEGTVTGIKIHGPGMAQPTCWAVFFTSCERWSFVKCQSHQRRPNRSPLSSPLPALRSPFSTPSQIDRSMVRPHR